MNRERMYQVLLAPHVSEKTAIAGDENNQYAFKVARDATKAEIKSAVEEIFDVVVTDLQVLNVKGKVKGAARGRPRKRPNWRKAYVRLREGDEIDLAGVG